MRACCVRARLCACASAHYMHVHVHVRATCRAPERSLAPLTRGKSAAGISAASSAETTISTEGRSFISRAEIRPLVPALDAAAQQGQRGAYAYSAPPAPAPTRSMRAMPSGAQAAAEFDDEVAERAHAAARKVAPPVRRIAPPVRRRQDILQPSRRHLPAITVLSPHHPPTNFPPSRRRPKLPRRRLRVHTPRQRRCPAPPPSTFRSRSRPLGVAPPRPRSQTAPLQTPLRRCGGRCRSSSEAHSGWAEASAPNPSPVSTPVPSRLEVSPDKPPLPMAAESGRG